MIKGIFLAVLVLGLIGCTMVETRTEGRRLDSAEIMQLKPGITTRQAAIDLFGAPTEIANKDGEEHLVYTFKEKKVPSYLGGLLVNESDITEEASTLMLVIIDGIVNSYKFNNLEY